MWIQDHDVRDALQKLRVFKHFSFGQTVESLKSGTAKHFGYFGEYFIRKNQLVAMFEQFFQKISCLG